MKRFLLLFTALSLLTAKAWTQNFKVDGIVYAINGLVVKVVKVENDPVILEIPQNVTYNGVKYPVTSIGDGPFTECTKLEVVNIPSTVELIMDKIFETTQNLKAINVAANNPTYSSIDGVLFTKSQNSLIRYPLAKAGLQLFSTYTIPSSVTDILPWAFSKCHKLHALVIPASVTSIWLEAFWDIKNLQQIHIRNSNPDNIDTHPIQFSPSSYSCRLYVPVGATSAYSKKKPWSDFVSTIEEKPIITVGGITYCITDPQKKYLSVGSDNQILTAVGVETTGSVTIPASVDYEGASYTVNGVANYAFYNCDKITSIALPNSITSIGDYAFVRCQKLTSISIPSQVTTIGEFAFTGCEMIAQLNIPASVTTIKRHAFSNCPLTSVSIPSSVTSIGREIFQGCKQLQTIQVDSNNPNYSSVDGVLFDKMQTTLVEYPEGHLSKKNYAIPTSVTTIGEFAFASTTGFDLVIPPSVKTIGDYAFQSCYQFAIHLKNYNPSDITAADCAFDAIDLASLPENKLYVPKGALSAYSSADPWKNFNYKYEEDFSFTVDGITYTITNFANREVAVYAGIDKAAISTTTAGEFNVPASVTYCGEKYSVTSIGRTAFLNCSALTSVNIPFSVTSIGVETFYGCTELLSVQIPSTVTSLGAGAFRNCVKLTSIRIPSSISSLTDYTFLNCSKLAAIYANNPIPPTILQISPSNFTGIAYGCKVYVPAGSKTAYQNANEWRHLNIVEDDLVVSQDIVSIDGTTGSKASVNVYSLLPWSATSSAPDWLQAGNNTKNPNGNGVLTLTAIATNPSTSTRVASVTVSDMNARSKTFTVIQQAGPPSLSVSTHQADIGAEENSVASVSVTSNAAWSATSNQSWLTVNPASATGDGTLTFTAQANPAITTRTATVTVSTTQGGVTKEIVVTQAAGPATLSVSSTLVNIGHAGNSIAKVNVASNASWSVSSNEAWLTVSPVNWLGDAQVTFTAAANPGMQERTATVTISVNGSLSKTVTVVQVIPDNALNFDGVDDFVYINDNDATITTAFTIETWVYWWQSNTSKVEFIYGKATEQMELHTGPTANSLRFIPTTGVYLDANNVLPIYRWTHVACVYDAANAVAKMYINGKEVALKNNGPNPVGKALQSTDQQFFLGRRMGGTAYSFTGSIDEVRVWNYARSESEIVGNILSPIANANTVQGLVNYYDFNEGIANGDNRHLHVNILPDKSATASQGNGTLSNFYMNGSTSNWAPGYKDPNAYAFLNLSNTSISIGADADSKATFDISTSTPVWKVTSDQAWLTVSPAFGSKNGTVTLTAGANPTTLERVAKVTVSALDLASKTITVTQAAKVPNLNVSSNTVTIGASANSTASVDVISNIDWTVVSNQAWLTVSPASSSGNGTITLSAAGNTTIVARTATVTVSASGVADQVITVTQAAGEPKLIVSVNTANVGADGNSTASVGVISNIDWTAVSSQAWLTVSPTSSSGNGTITFTAAENTAIVSRTANVTVSGAGVADQVIAVTQAAWEPKLIVAANTANVGADENSTASVGVISNIDWTAVSSQAWLTVSPTSSSGNGTITFTAAENTAIVSRTANVTVSGAGVADQVIAVTQAAGEPKLIVSANTTNVGAAEHSAALVDVTSNTDWTVVSDQAWLTVSPASSTGNGTITFTATKNKDASVRTATVTVSAAGVANQVVTVTQAAGALSYTITANAKPESYGTVTGAGVFDNGANVTLTAVPNSNYTFVNWTENGTEVSKEASYSFTVSANRTLVANFKVATGINDVTETSKISVYPNPVKSDLTIEVKGNNQYLNFELVNVAGYVVSQGKIIDKTTLPMGNITPGVYILRLENAGKIEFRKIVKE